MVITASFTLLLAHLLQKSKPFDAVIEWKIVVSSNVDDAVVAAEESRLGEKFLVTQHSCQQFSYIENEPDKTHLICFVGSAEKAYLQGISSDDIPIESLWVEYLIQINNDGTYSLALIPWVTGVRPY